MAVELVAALAERRGLADGGLPRGVVNDIDVGARDDAEDRMIIDDGIAAFGRGEFTPEIAPARRRLILARLIAAWSEAIHSGRRPSACASVRLRPTQ